MNSKSDVSKCIIVIVLLLSAMGLIFALPKGIKYRGTNFISQLKLPPVITDWYGEDVSSKININSKDEVYNFLGDFLAYQYVNKDKASLLFILLDAGNFHYPNRCLNLSGYEVKELNKTPLYAAGRTLNAYTLHAKKTSGEEYLILYWIVIDKRPIPNWVEQKVKQLYFSLFNKKRVGLMARIDIPIQRGNFADGLILAKQFIGDLSQKLPPEQADYIFGEIK